MWVNFFTIIIFSVFFFFVFFLYIFQFSVYCFFLIGVDSLLFFAEIVEDFINSGF